MADSRDQVSVAFTELAVSVMPEVRLPGVEAAHATVRRRRHRRVAVLAAVVAVVLLVPSAAFALMRVRGDAGPDIGGTSAPPPSSPTGTASPTGSATPSATGSPQGDGLHVIRDAYAPDGRPMDDALLEIPAFPSPGAQHCPAGETQYTHGGWQYEVAQDTPENVSSSIEEVATGDVDRDGSTDWVAVISCEFGPLTYMNQVVAFTKHGNEPYRLLGQVFVPDTNYLAGEPDVATDGVIRLSVTGPAETVQETYERRSFQWNGSGFVSVGSPVVLPIPDPTALSLTITPSTVSGPSTMLSVTVHNVGTSSPDYLELMFRASLLDRDAGRLTSISIRPEGLVADLRPHGECRGTAGCAWVVELEPVPAGQSATGRFTVSFPTTITGGNLLVDIAGVTRGYGPRENAAGGSLVVPLAAG